MPRPTRTSALAAVALLGTGALTVSLLAAPAEAAPRGTRVSAALSATFSNPGGVVVMTGYVKDKGKHRRTVVLEQKIAGGWRRVSKATSDTSGAYTLPVRTDWFYSSKLRTRVAKTRKLRGATSRAKRMGVGPAYVPLGSPSSWVKISREGQRYNPCRTITYGINTSRATPDAGTVTTGVQNALALVAQATGVRFAFVGESSSVPFDKKYRRKDPKMLFAFTTDAETPLDLGPSVAARGGADRTRWARDAHGKRIPETTSGGILYDLNDTATMTAAQFEQLTLHEIGHAMGLGHVAPTDQYMTPGPELYNLPLSYQAGDLKGLSKMGLQAGCVRPLRAGRRSVASRLPVPVAATFD